MIRKSTLFPVLVFLVFAILLTGCKKDDPETLYMSGSLTFDLPEYCFRGETFLVEASGITSPKGDSVSFTFEGDHFTPDSIEAATAEIKVPDSLGTYTLTLTARAEGYANSVTSRKTTVIHNVFSVMAEGFKPSSDSITDPRDGHVYYYKRFGNLDWFIQNLNWNQVGLTYNNVPVLGNMLGGLYTWNQAMSGENAPVNPPVPASGLGAGPQGVCPPGWRIPTAEDWADLASSVTGTSMGFLDPWNGLGE
nr:FISUMP domain-containing protein [Bacteroidales bacterium]